MVVLSLEVEVSAIVKGRRNKFSPFKRAVGRETFDPVLGGCAKR